MTTSVPKSKSSRMILIVLITSALAAVVGVGVTFGLKEAVRDRDAEAYDKFMQEIDDEIAASKAPLLSKEEKARKWLISEAPPRNRPWQPTEFFDVVFRLSKVVESEKSLQLSDAQIGPLLKYVFDPARRSMLSDEKIDIAGRVAAAAFFGRGYEMLLNSYAQAVEEGRPVTDEYSLTLAPYLESRALLMQLSDKAIDQPIDDFPTEEYFALREMHREINRRDLTENINLTAKHFSSKRFGKLNVEQQSRFLAAVEKGLPQLAEYAYSVGFDSLTKALTETEALAAGKEIQARIVQLVSKIGSFKRVEDPFSGKPVRFAMADIPVPAFPELGEPEEFESPNAIAYHVTLVPSGKVEIPGHSMSLRIWIPSGDHAHHSLKCILMGPSGTNLRSGKELVSDDYGVEIGPYLKAGHVVICYSIDGSILETEDESISLAVLHAQLGYWHFRQAQAGLVNARNAFEFVLQRVPQVDSKQIYAAGHSSGGTLALLFAEHDPRVAGCIAFAPETNVNADGTIQSVDNNGSMPGIYGFSQRSSPLSHLAQLKCPVFLFHARDDSVVPMKQIEEFVSQLKTFNNHVTFQPEDTGEHYDGMIQVGLGTAVEWLSTQGMSK